ncbi:UNVERIFIED_CONTAM: hypothetical protein Sradi_0278900 [Sesamum radiatum]|uniref:Uncharacterized protein n=1 Tax=Sesamum radiatum TaxID=300843 RepID=A0AAW2W3F3_SESRA
MVDGFETEFGLTTGLIPGFALGPNEKSGCVAGSMSEVSAGGGAASAAGSEPKQ